jgi:hypothetical protein
LDNIRLFACKAGVYQIGARDSTLIVGSLLSPQILD